MNNETREKLSKLIPMLATEHAGEKVATVDAIGRTLKSEGLDFHDLSKLLTQPRPLSGPAFYSSQPKKPPSRGLQGKDGLLRPWMQVADEILSRYETIPKRYGGGFLLNHQIAVLQRIRVGAEEGHLHEPMMKRIDDQVRTAWEAQEADRARKKSA